MPLRIGTALVLIRWSVGTGITGPKDDRTSTANSHELQRLLESTSCNLGQSEVYRFGSRKGKELGVRRAKVHGPSNPVLT